MSPTDGQRRSPQARRWLFAAVGLLAAALLAPGLGGTRASPLLTELGDAPDRTNHVGAGMTAFPGVPALYPVVYDGALGVPQGPLHTNPIQNGWLGQGFSGEKDADLLPDTEGFTNIDPASNTPNRDKFDDGVNPPNGGIIKLPHCAQTRFRYIVTGASAVPVPNAYVNVWFDWNRDGDWADRIVCTNAAGAVVVVPEWAVQNQPVTIVPGSVVWSTPAFYSAFAGNHKDTWMRISIAEIKAPANPITAIFDGSGPAPGYKYGETEDYFLYYTGDGVSFKPQ